MSLLLRYQAAIRLFPIGPKLSSTSHKFEDASPPFASRLSLTPYFGSYRTYQDDARHRRTRSLVELVQKERYAAAERVRLHLVSECEPIDPDPVYERAAIAQIRWHGRQDLTAFLTWLALVPDNKVPLRVENGPLTKTRNILFRTGNPARNLLLITEFSLLCAAKGYGQLVWNDLVHLMVGFQHPDKALAFFLSFEAALLRYYSKYHPSFVQEIASRQRSLLIMICCDAEWLDAAVQVVRDSQEHRLNRACERLVELLQNRNDVARLAIVEELLAGRRQANDGSASENRLQVSTLDQSENMSAVQRISQMFIGSGGPSKKTSLDMDSLTTTTGQTFALHTIPCL
ncbi:hypothetical protein B0H10DRAFT_310865 [Mycena sp. CBHHK59/15]|nr:hypothetical protein B0H10DRAFT_310865 [Mycena sp. CBHHK59/15]